MTNAQLALKWEMKAAAAWAAAERSEARAEKEMDTDRCLDHIRSAANARGRYLAYREAAKDLRTSWKGEK